VRPRDGPGPHEIRSLTADDVDRRLDDVAEARAVLVERRAQVVDAEGGLRLEVAGTRDDTFPVDRARACREHEIACDGGVLVRGTRPERHRSTLPLD
jgi:hypothetical protein